MKLENNRPKAIVFHHEEEILVKKEDVPKMRKKIMTKREDTAVLNELWMPEHTKFLKMIYQEDPSSASLIDKFKAQFPEHSEYWNATAFKNKVPRLFSEGISIVRDLMCEKEYRHLPPLEEIDHNMGRTICRQSRALKVRLVMLAALEDKSNMMKMRVLV